MQGIEKQEQLSSFLDLLQWYDNKDFVPNSEEKQKMTAFYHDAYINMLKVGFTLPKLAKICLH